MKKFVIACALFICAAPVHSQLLKKIKDKVNKKIDNSIDKATGTEETKASSAEADNKKKTPWCDTAKVDGTPGSDGVAYSLAYSSQGKMDIVYEESSLGLANDPKGYRIILSEYVNNKQQFVVVENGKVVSRDTKVKDEYLTGAGLGQFSAVGDADPRDKDMKKYIVPDTLKINAPKTGAKSVTVQKIDDDQASMALQIARQTDEYKNMSAAEKKEFEDAMNAGIKENNSRAGQTYTSPAFAGASAAGISGYKLIVKGKNLAKFILPPAVEVSKDETNIFAVGADEKGEPIMISNGKKTPLDKNKYTGMNGKMLRSRDRSKFVYIEQKKMTNEDVAQMSSGNMVMSYTVLKKDGSAITLSDYNSSGKFTLTDAGAVININESTGEVYSDGKKIGKFILKDGGSISSDAILMGGDVSKISYYDGSNGSINYLDGSSKNLGVMFPKVIPQNGKSYLTWFRKCRNDIYIAKFEY